MSSINAMAHDENVVAKLRHALETVVGLPREHHEAIIHACRAAGLIPAGYSGGELRAGADSGKQSIIDRLDASLASSEPAIKSTAEMLQGLLRRAGVSRDDIADGDITKLDKAFAASRLSTTDKLVAKNLLFRLGAIG
jgi:hypothetical protein